MSDAICADDDINVLAVTTSFVAILLANDALSETNDPLISEAICADDEIILGTFAFKCAADKEPDISEAIWIEPDITPSDVPDPASKFVSLVDIDELGATNEPDMSDAIWAAPEIIPLGSPTYESAVIVPLELISPVTLIDPETSNSNAGFGCPIPTRDATFWLLALTPNKTFWVLSNVPGLNLKSLPSNERSKYLSASVLFNLKRVLPLLPSIITFWVVELETCNVAEGLL